MVRTDPNRLIEIARLYYREDLSQQEIATRLGVSRPTVCGALKRCRAQGIVEIRIRDPDSPAVTLGAGLERAYGLRRAIVAEAGADADERTRNLGRAAAEYVAGQLKDGTRIGLSWGTTLYQFVQHLRVRPRARLEVAQLIGALGSVNPRHDGFELARDLAARLNGAYRVIQAPALVRTVELKRMLLQERAIREALRRAAAVDLAVIGISSDLPGHSALVRAGYVTAKEARALCRAGAVGHACGWHFDGDGRALATPLNDRLMGISFDELRRIPTVVGVAGGAEKVEAIRGALRGGLLDVLVTDERTAHALSAAPAPEGGRA
jgi:DNA-binding transcriptional regulator LsrR (DeoR family)